MEEMGLGRFSPRIRPLSHFALLLLTTQSLFGAERITVGLTENRTIIDGFSVAARDGESRTVLLIGGFHDDGSAVAAEVQRFDAIPRFRRRFRLLAVPVANPAKARLVFPPTGSAYRTNPESHALWRWAGTQAPDLVLIAGEEDYGFADALANNAVAGIGRIPVRHVEASVGMLDTIRGKIPKSEARTEIERRQARTSRQVAEQLSQVYGREFNEAVYIPAMALIGRLRLGQLEDVERIVAPYVNGSMDSLANPTGSHLGGHLIFGELAERTGKQRYVELVRKAADLGFAPSGEMKEAVPFHVEMSDAIFMGCPILAKAGKLTRDRKYFDMALRHMEFIQELCLRPDGIYRNSPLSDAAWGRGNAFPALGLALTLSDLPRDHAAFGPILRSFQNHMRALARFQDENGMWRQVIDYPGAYPEFSATAMITTAMLRGIRNGWLDRRVYRPQVRKAWKALSARIAPDGQLIDVCEGTGKQPSLEDYLNREAILGRDPRGGAMALLAATEMAGPPPRPSSARRHRK